MTIGMKKWSLITLVVVLAALALTARWWLHSFLTFAGAHADVIQSVTSLVQLAIWTAAGLAAIAGLWSSRKKISPAPTGPAAAQAPTIQASGPGAVATGRDITHSSVVTGDDNIVITVNEAQAPEITYLYQLPPALDDFTDRVDEAAELSGKLDEGTRVYGLFGMGGIGKSDLAKKFAHQHLLDRYPDAQFYLDLEGASPKPKSVADVQSHIIGSCQSTEKVYENDKVNLSAKYHSVLNGKNALLVLDNAADEAQLTPLIPPPNCAMVITSRQQIYLPSIHAMTLQTLKPEDACDLLLRIAARIGPQAETIARLCGYLPMALRLAAGVIAVRPDLEVADYVERLGERSERLGFVQASLDLSYALFSADQQTQFCRLAIFPESFEAGAVAAMWDQKVDATKDALGLFFKFSMVEWHQRAARYRLQTLVRDFADAHLTDGERARTQSRHAQYYLRVLKEAGQRYLKGDTVSRDGLNLFDVERANIEAAQAWIEANLADRTVAAAAFANYSYSGSRLLILKQPPQARMRWHQAILNATRSSGSNDRSIRQIEASSLIFLGITNRESGEYDQTIAYCEEALRIARDLKAEREESDALGYLGIAHFYKGNYPEARASITSALDIAHGKNDEDRPADAEKLRHLGHSYRGLGEFEQAIEFYQRSLISTRQLGDLSGESNALGALGRIFCDTGRQNQARTEFLPQALKLAAETGNRTDECFNLAHFGLAHRDLGLYAEAIDYYERALKVAREIGARAVEAYSHGGLGKSYLALEDFARALSNTLAAVNIADQIKMPRAQQYWETIGAQIYLYTNQMDNALASIERAKGYKSKWVNYRTSALRGVILLRLNQSEPAGEAFVESVKSANELIAKTPTYFDARYISALAICGIAMTNPEDRALRLTESCNAYTQAYANCSAAGVVREALGLLGQLLKPTSDPALFAPRDLLKKLADGPPSP
ncbi:MAG: hypothetical protein QOH70_2557 [Blastocatellia bacterium]|jgi:tetratricopeptide (TPR) repeat protein|nr:hypothetical protein [Blastocatellia bacterium]